MQDNGSTIAVNSVEESEQLQSAIAGYIVYGFEILLVSTYFIQTEKNR